MLHDAQQHSQSMAAWKVLLTPDDASSCPLPAQEIRAIFNGLLMRSVVPVACAQLKHWQPQLQSAVAPALMQAWGAVLTDSCSLFIVEHAILPRVMQAAEAWEPARDVQPIDSLLLPLLPLLGAWADAVLPVVRV